MASISNQNSRDWRAIVVANEGADLPDLPAGVEALRVTFPPNQLHDRGNATLEEFYDAFRIDKGRRVMAAMLAAKESGHFMIVDDDDFVSSQLAEFVSKHRKANGWVIEDGYFWTDEGKLLYEHSHLNGFCGSTLIIRADLYDLPKAASGWSDERIRTMLGSHRRIAESLAKSGSPLQRLPFRGAIYRIGHAGNHSGKGGIASVFFWNKRYLRRPWQFVPQLFRLKRVSQKVRLEFFGDKAAASEAH